MAPSAPSDPPAVIAPVAPARSLARVLPSVATSLGVPGLAAPGDRELPPARGAVVVLVDGLGARLLSRRGGHAPFLRRMSGVELGCGFPSTTATSMGSLGTGVLAGEHGLVGYEAYDPARDLVFNELSWEDGPDPRSWQPRATVHELCEGSGVAVTRIGPRHVDGSGLTRAALRGGRFAAASSLAAGVDEALAALRQSPGSLVHLYWAELDKVGHVHGCESWQWGEELEAIDAELSRLARSLPAGVALHVTADHGMVDVPDESRLDITEEAELAAGVRHVSGEPRALQLHVQPGAVEDVRAAWTSRLGEDAVIRTRDEVVDAGWFGPVSEDVRPRIGDLVVAMVGRVAVSDARRHRPELRALRGLHGSITADEVAIPWLTQEGHDG